MSKDFVGDDEVATFRNGTPEDRLARSHRPECPQEMRQTPFQDNGQRFLSPRNQKYELARKTDDTFVYRSKTVLYTTSVLTDYLLKHCGHCGSPPYTDRHRKKRKTQERLFLTRGFLVIFSVYDKKKYHNDV
jgi:hypothetical protein